MAATLKLEIVTPEEKIYSEDVEMVTLPGVEGQLGVFPQHVPLLTQMLPGEVIVNKGGQTQLLAVGEGVIEVTADHVSILTDMALDADHIDEAKVESINCGQSYIKHIAAETIHEIRARTLCATVSGSRRFSSPSCCARNTPPRATRSA